VPLDSDLNYVFLAPSPNWRGAKLYNEPYSQSQPTTALLGSVSLPDTIITVNPAKPARKPRSPGNPKRPQSAR
jgi:hypothetical protein